ncbi:MAG: thioredoxin [Clostridiaceae bacterium]|nr:thioredoxin [Clostridiaceae bacterium]
MRRRILQIGLGALALTALILGIAFDQHAAVLRKAIYVCLECIGLG